MDKELKKQIIQYLIRNYRMMHEYEMDDNEEMEEWYYNKTAGVEEMLTWCGYYIKITNGTEIDIVKDESLESNHIH